MISLAQFIQNTQGQSLLYPPNPESLRGQCVQPDMFYMEQVWGLSPYWRDYAYQYFTVPDDRFDYTTNDPNNASQIPPVGALIVWSSALPGSLGSGHIAIFISNNGNHTFTSYDSNWGGKMCHYVSHDWSNILGWFTPKQAAVVMAGATITTNTNNEDEMITTQDAATKVYKMLRPNGQPSQGEIDSTVNKRTYQAFVNDAQNEVNQRDANLNAQLVHLNDLQSLINQQNETITQLSTSNATTKQEYDEALATIASQNAQLATKHDLISDTQAKLSAVVEPAADVQTETVADEPKVKSPSWTTKFLMWVLSRRKKNS